MMLLDLSKIEAGRMGACILKPSIYLRLINEMGYYPSSSNIEELQYYPGARGRGTGSKWRADYHEGPPDLIQLA